ncbi:MAG TPA: hypothetical protein VKD24_01520 [Candidatus Angelobacter sp.]|jgi:hypothetical protein|nr:hypothetical protein [Candidatus Angelobacter sp.]
MKIAAMLAGIALSINVAMGLLNLALNVSRMGIRFVPGYVGSQATWLFAEVCMIAFFFSFYVRAKE